MKKWLVTGCLLSFVMLQGAVPPALKIQKDGVVKMGNVEFKWQYFAPGWNMVAYDKKSVAVNSPGKTVWDLAANGKFNCNFTFTPRDNGVNIAADLTVPEGKPVNAESLAYGFNLDVEDKPLISADGREIVIPEKFGELRLFDGKVKNITVSCNNETVVLTGDGEMRILVQDDRKWATGQIEVRIFPESNRGNISQSRISLNLDMVPSRSFQVDLRGVANMGFRDERADDGKGGWTDQGPANDLGMLKPGELYAESVVFDVIDGAKNNGKSCLVLSKEQQKFPAKTELAVGPVDHEPKYLFLLHASAWTPDAKTPVGTLTIEYADGKKQEISVLAGRDVGNWWNPIALPNAAIAYTDENKESFVGLYLSQFELAGTPVKLSFSAGERAVWMIAGVTLGERKIAMNTVVNPVYYVADQKFIPLEFDRKVIDGSPLDFSRYADAPAGKYGPVIVSKTGTFTFRDKPDKRIRFFGPNLVFSANYLSKQEADKFADYAAQMGYNSVRFHHYESMLQDQRANDSLTFNPENWDKLNYLFAKLKEKGIYICIDLYASRVIKPGDNIEEYKKFTGQELKGLIPLSPSAMANYKAFARKLLTTKNPYTGLTWAEDPGLYSLNLVNENPLVAVWNDFPEIRALYEQKFVEYLEANKLDTPANRANRGALFVRFLNQLQADAIAEQTRFLRDEIKLTALITDLNFMNNYALTGLREELEFVDNHQYFDHPNFPVQKWNMPFAYAQNSSLRRAADLPRYIMPVRIFGKPYTVTEFNYCNPNVNRLEYPTLVGAYSALQNWDGIYRFAWSHNREAMEQVKAPGGFDIVNDPQALLAERIIYMLFVRGDVSPAEGRYAFDYNDKDLEQTYAVGNGAYLREFTMLGLYGQIGSLGKHDFDHIKRYNVFADNWLNELPIDARRALQTFEASGEITSQTGQVTLNTERSSLKAVTPKSEVFTARSDIKGKFFELTEWSTYQTVAFMSLDDKELAESGRILVIQLPNLGATMQKFSDKNLKVVEKWGTLPVLLERARVKVAFTSAKQCTVQALKLDGSVAGPVTASQVDGKTVFMLDNSAFPGGTMVYLVMR